MDFSEVAGGEMKTKKKGNERKIGEKRFFGTQKLLSSSYSLFFLNGYIEHIFIILFLSTTPRQSNDSMMTY